MGNIISSVLRKQKLNEKSNFSFPLTVFFKMAVQGRQDFFLSDYEKQTYDIYSIANLAFRLPASMNGLLLSVKADF